MAGSQETGNETYICRLCERLPLLAPDINFIIATYDCDFFPQLKKLPNVEIVHISRAPIRRLFFELPYISRKYKADLMHGTYALPLMPGCKTVVSVHDVSFMEHPEWFSKRDQLVLRLGVSSSIKQASIVLTISNFSKSAIMTNYKASCNRIVSIPIGVDIERFTNPPQLSSKLKKQYGITKPYILALGNLQPRKNIKRLIDAFHSSKQSIKEPLQLILAGKAQFKSNEIIKQVERLGLKDDISFTGYVRDEDLPSLYGGANIFIYPSLYEGFGLPILEAMAAGVAVISSKTTAMPEVCGNAVHYINPTDSNDIANAIIKIANDKVYRSRLVEKGLKRAVSYTWDKTALDTLKIYRQILEKKES